MPKRVKEKPVIFSTGWDTRGSGVGEPTAIIDLRNAWMSRDDIGAVEAMPGDSVLVDWSALTDDPLVSLAAGTNTRGVLATDGEWPGETIEAGTIGIIGVAQYGEIFYANYDSGGDTTGELIAAFSGGATDEKQWPFSGIVSLNDTFYIFHGVQRSIRLPQKSVIGSTVIDDIGVDRPDTSDVADINLSLNPAGDSTDRVVGVVRYWITEIEQGNESAHSEAIRRVADIKHRLYFDGTDDDVGWGDVHDLDTTASFTIEVKLRFREAPSAAEFMFGKKSTMADGTPGWMFELLDTGKVRFVLSDGTNTAKVSTKDSVCDNRWHRVSATFDITGTDTLKIYRDGEFQNHDTDCSDVTDSGNVVNMTAGSTSAGGADLKGSLADFRIWNTVRTQAEIQDKGFQILYGDETGLVGYWPTLYNSAATTTLADYVGSSDGTLSAATLWKDNTSYGDPVINCGDGSRVDISFTASRFHGKTYNIYRSYRNAAIPFLVGEFTPTGGVAMLQVQYTGGSSPGTMTIGGLGPTKTNRLRTYENGVLDLDLDLTDAANDTLTELVAVINGDANYTCTIDAGATGGDASTLLLPVNSVDIETQPYLAWGEEDDAIWVYTDDLHDDYLGNPQFVHGDQPNPKARPAVVHMNRIFIADGSYLYWSDIANEESFWWKDSSDLVDGHNEVGNYIRVYPDDGDRITALVSDYDSVIIFKANHIYRLYGRQPEEFNLRPIIPSTSIPVAVGAPNASSVCSTPDGIVFYWNRKVYILSGGILKKISDPIEEPLNALILIGGGENNEWYTATVSYWAGRNQVWVGIGSSALSPNLSFIYDLTTQRWIGKRNRGYIDAQSLRSWGPWQGDFSDEKFIGGSPLQSLDGRVIDIIDTGETAYAGAVAYTTWMEVAPFFGGNLNNIKKFLWVDVIFEPQAAGEFDFIYWVDGKSASAVTETVPMTVTGTPARHKSRVNINANGESLSVKIGNTPDDDGMWKIFGLVYGYQDQESISR